MLQQRLFCIDEIVRQAENESGMKQGGPQLPAAAERMSSEKSRSAIPRSFSDSCDPSEEKIEPNPSFSMRVSSIFP